jgi:hypothetical protein
MINLFFMKFLCFVYSYFLYINFTGHFPKNNIIEGDPDHLFRSHETQ